MMKRLKTSLIIIAAFLAGSLVSIATTVVLAHGGDTSKIHSCVRNNQVGNLANIRIVDANTNCNNTETPLDWNIQGVQGPAGPQGPSGPTASGSGYFGLPFICLKACDLSPIANKFAGKDFSDAYMPGVLFNNVDLTGVIFKNGFLRGGKFDESNLSNANLSNTDFSSGGWGVGTASFSNTILQNTNFQNANLTSANFLGAQNMDTANLTGVNWNNTTCPDGTNSDNNGNTCIGHLTP